MGRKRVNKSKNKIQTRKIVKGVERIRFETRSINRSNSRIIISHQNGMQTHTYFYRLDGSSQPNKWVIRDSRKKYSAICRESKGINKAVHELQVGTCSEIKEKTS